MDVCTKELLFFFFFAQNSPTWVGEHGTGFKIDDLLENLLLKKIKNQFLDHELIENQISKSREKSIFRRLI